MSLSPYTSWIIVTNHWKTRGNPDEFSVHIYVNACIVHFSIG